MLCLEAERAGHAAAAGVELDHLGARDALQQGDGRLRAGERLLVAVAVEEDALRPVPQRQVGVEQQLLDQPHARRDAAVAEQLHVLLAQRQQAGRLAAGDQRVCRPDVRVKASAFAVASSSSPLEIAARPQHPRGLEPHVVAGGLEQLDRRRGRRPAR